MKVIQYLLKLKVVRTEIITKIVSEFFKIFLVFKAVSFLDVVEVKHKYLRRGKKMYEVLVYWLISLFLPCFFALALRMDEFALAC